MKYQRLIQRQIEDKLTPGKVIVLYGARQTGKTTIAKDIARKLSGKTVFVNAEEPQSSALLAKRNLDGLRDLIGKRKYLIIDEAQSVENIGLTLKIIVDTFTDVSVLVTGSSSFDLSSKISEPLTGRKSTFTLYPVSVEEITLTQGSSILPDQADRLLIWGSYPELLTLDNSENRREYLMELSDSYLFKDILAVENIRRASKIKKLVQLLSFQIGSEVSLSELGTQLELDRKTVERYLDLLEKSFVIFHLAGFSRNMRKEISKSYKYYFYDLGIRNVMIDSFKPLDLRDDVGKLWENFLILERLKHNSYARNFAAGYFWRTYSGAEVDYVEEKETQLSGYEFKYKDKSVKPPAAWTQTYNASWNLVNPKNWRDFVTAKI